MKKIWRYITATKNAVGNILFIGITLVIIFALVTSDKIQVPDSSVLVLGLDGVIVEQKSVINPFDLLESDDFYSEVLLRDVVDAVNFAREDERIKAIALDLSDLAGGSMSQFDEIAVSLQAFKDTGKPIFAFAGYYTQAQYYLASFADAVYLDKNDKSFPGGVLLSGIGVYGLYLKSALEKIHAQFHVFQAGQYKDAVEVFLRDGMSDHAREAAEAWLQVVWDGYLTTITDQRGISADDLANYIDNYDKLLDEVDSDPAVLAIRYGLVDDQLTRAEWRQKLIHTVGASEDSYAHISHDEYLDAQPSPVSIVDSGSEKIAIIVIEGELVDGEQSIDKAGADTLVEFIRQAGDDDAIKAVVVRINSPGGSISASELIRSELALVRQNGKPIVASMAGVAASGGYWIASVADVILASGTTVTGSIGVFSLVLALDQSLTQLGIHPDGTGTTALSSSSRWFMPINPVMKNLIQKATIKGYKDFIELVADGRGLSFEEADAVAQGRVWAGETALELGLIDKLGTITDALESAAMLADIQDYTVVYLEEELTPQEEFFIAFIESIDAVAGVGSTGNIGSAAFNWSLLQEGFNRALPPSLRNVRALGNSVIKQPGLYAQCMTCQISF